MSQRGATPREKVYTIIDGERNYQKSRWGDDQETEINSFILYMEHHLQRAREVASTQTNGNNSPGATGESSLDCIRKVTALGVACMEANGAPTRAKPGCEHVSGPARCSDCAYES
ncbi:hypothetical protein LCGC14_1973410 [marine sediment metagenome]|uniref:Uncharacterized protein n=1 Tax=marine sediment metagenome TaxID=412755 RepID=A0A0F9FBH8_9ZZZZ